MRVLYDYVATEKGVLSLRAGEVCELVENKDQGWVSMKTAAGQVASLSLSRSLSLSLSRLLSFSCSLSLSLARSLSLALLRSLSLSLGPGLGQHEDGSPKTVTLHLQPYTQTLNPKP